MSKPCCLAHKTYVVILLFYDAFIIEIDLRINYIKVKLFLDYINLLLYNVCTNIFAIVFLFFAII